MVSSARNGLQLGSMSSRHHGFIPSSAEDTLRRRVKVELRKRMRGVRGALPAAVCADRSARIVERLLSLDVVARARTAALFWPMEERHEVDLRALDARLRERGVRIAYPALEAQGEHEDMVFRWVADTSGMREHRLGMRQPAPDAPQVSPGSLDIIVAPALAVDPRGHRIGYGSGHYDRALRTFSPVAAGVAVAFDFQLVAEVPETERDVKVAWVVTDARVLDARSA